MQSNAVMHPRTKNSGHIYRMDDCVLESNNSEKDLEVIKDRQLRNTPSGKTAYAIFGV